MSASPSDSNSANSARSEAMPIATVVPGEAAGSTPPRSLQLRALTIADVPAALALDQHCFGGLWRESGYQREIESPNSDLLGLFSQPRSPDGTTPIDEALIGVGCVWAILEEAHITLLGIHPDYRRQGLGNHLLCQLLRSAQQRGLERATLEVRDRNQAAIALYQSFGFKRAGCRRNYYPDGEAALILWRNHLHRPEFQADIAHQEAISTQRLHQHAWRLSLH